MDFRDSEALSARDHGHLLKAKVPQSHKRRQFCIKMLLYMGQDRGRIRSPLVSASQYCA
jgi:hypothetical protein